jgi:hypothetical protein
MTAFQKVYNFPLLVIPVKTGIQSFLFIEFRLFWIPACAGMTTFYKIVGFESKPSQYAS